MMCAIVGALLFGSFHETEADRILNHIFTCSLERGRDGRGWKVFVQQDEGREAHIPERNTIWEDVDFFRNGHSHFAASQWMIGNMRAEPTTEYVHEKHDYDQQPYSLNGWNIVHNGTIANDKELRSHTRRGHPTHIDSAAIVEDLAVSTMLTSPDYGKAFTRTIADLKGSYAILATHDNDPDHMYVAVNYRPLWYVRTEFGYFFASARGYFPSYIGVPQMLPPYTTAVFSYEGIEVQWSQEVGYKALVVCSGGLDSVVAAAWAQNSGYEVELIHFQYGSRAEGPEVRAVQAVAQALQVPLKLFPLPIYQPSDSPLLRADSAIAGGEAGAEFAHEWVPARNLVMLSVATAYAEANGFDTIVLGNNLEEAGAYPDNEPEFIDRFNDLLPFAVGDGKRVRVIMPVGNLMKHEIVKLGHALGAPLDKTWSCYRAGEHHCGTCGPCFMRRTAFNINNFPEVIRYEH